MSYSKTDYDKLRARYLRRKSGEDQAWFRPEIGQKYRFRILPPFAGRDAWYVEYGVHYNIGDDEERSTVTCARLTLKKPCPVCEFNRALWKSGQDADKATASNLKASRRFASNVLILSSQTPNEPRIWAYPATVWDQLTEVAVGNERGIVQIEDPDHGHNFNLNVQKRQTGEKVFPNYIVSPEMQPSVIADKSALSKLVDVHALIWGNVRPYDEVRSQLLGETVSENVSPAVAPPVDNVVVAPTEEVQEEVVEEHEEPQHETPPPTQAAASDIIAKYRAAFGKKK